MDCIINETTKYISGLAYKKEER